MTLCKADDTLHRMPAGIQPLLAEAQHLHQAGRLTEAERIYRQILESMPRHAETLHSLGVLAYQTGRHDVAVTLITAAIEQQPTVAAFHNNLGNTLKAQGNLAAAASAYRRALALKPDHAQAHYNLGIVLQAQGALTEAADSYRRALALRAGHPQTHNNLGTTLQAQGDLEAAQAAFRRAIALEPGYAEAHGNLGSALRAQGRLAEALACYEHSLSLKPDSAETHNNLGMILLQLGRPAEAAAACRRSLTHRPDYAQAYCTLGHALRELGEAKDATAAYERALALDPVCAEARLGLAVSAIPLMAEDAAESLAVTAAFMQSLEALTAWSRAHPGKLGQVVGRVQPFHLAYGCRDVTDALCRYGDLVCAEAAAHLRPQASRPRTARARRERIRLLIITAHVRQHPVWAVILRGILGQIDRQRFETIVYHMDATTDGETAWARARADCFVQGPRPLQCWIDQAAHDMPDVILYPEVGMDATTCALAALRLAPVQAASWGHPVTTGLPTIDLFLTGESLEPAGAEAHYRERLVRLPGTGVCTEWSATRAQHWGGPDRRRGVVRFALCQQPIKLDPADDGLLARILHDAGPCELWLAAPKNLPWAAPRLMARLARALRTHGLDPEAHLRLLDWLPPGQFASFLEEMDVYLDCPAFSGYTTAWQAAHHGLPVITLEGANLRQRLASGLLRQMGVRDGIVSSPQSYVATATQWAQDARRPDSWMERREALRRAAPTADRNVAAIAVLEETLIEAVNRAPALEAPA